MEVSQRKLWTSQAMINKKRKKGKRKRKECRRLNNQQRRETDRVREVYMEETYDDQFYG